MASRGIRAHPVFRLGKAKAKRDRRNFKFAAFVRAAQLPRIPGEFDFDLRHPGIPTPMFGNDEYGDCVIAGRAHQTLRFERIEQGSDLMIPDRAVVGEYLRESGGADSGLVVLESLKAWRSKGWAVGRHRYRIEAFAEIEPGNRGALRAAIYLLTGAGVGLSLPESAQEEIQAGRPWSRTSGRGTRAGSWGGHYVYLCGYGRAGPVCVTWGRKQAMTWEWFGKYCDEAYAICDALDRWRRVPGIDVARLRGYLEGL